MIHWNECTALFGGRFDPPHLGHLAAIDGLFENPGVKEVWVLPTPTPRHKETQIPLEHRLAMAQRGLVDPFQKMGSKAVRMEMSEIERSLKQPHLPTYTYDTLQDLKRNNPKLAFVIGADQLESFTSWHRFQETLQLSHWIILGRQPHGLDSGHKILAQWEASGIIHKTKKTDQWQISGSEKYLILCPTPARPISSTEIRTALARTGELPKDLLQDEVSAYLKLNKLYGIRGT